MKATPDLIIDKILKVKSLAENGCTIGERNAAMRALEALMEKHGLTEADILSERRETYAFKVPTRDINLFCCCLYSVVGWGEKRKMFRPAKGPGKATLYYIELTAREHADVKTLYDFYRVAIKKEEILFFRAFITKHGIAAPADVCGSPKKENQDDVHTAFQYMRAMRTHQNPLQVGQIGMDGAI